MITLNPRTQLIAKISKGNIVRGQIVKIIDPKDYRTECIVENRNGDSGHFFDKELKSIAVLAHTYDSKYFEINSEEKNVNERYGFAHGFRHLSKNVRTAHKFTIGRDIFYIDSVPENYPEYLEKTLTDEEVVDILLEEVVYGKQPHLQSTSLVGTQLKGLDNDPNYCNGQYYLPNEKYYTVTHCCGIIKIREGKDNGWYVGDGEVGQTLYEGEIDWERFRDAVVKENIIRYVYHNTAEIVDRFPKVYEELSKEFKENDYYKLSNEF